MELNAVEATVANAIVRRDTENLKDSYMGRFQDVINAYNDLRSEFDEYVDLIDSYVDEKQKEKFADIVSYVAYELPDDVNASNIESLLSMIKTSAEFMTSALATYNRATEFAEQYKEKIKATVDSAFESVEQTLHG